MTSQTLRSVKVTAWLSSPLVLTSDGAAPQLDALVEWAMCGTRRRGAKVDAPGQIPIPIKRVMVDGLPVPLCSAGIWTGQQRVEHFGRRFPNELCELLAEDERTVMRPTSGLFKSFHLPLRVVDCDRVVWFAVLHDSKSSLRHELKDVHFLGKKSSQGYGAISKWEVEDADADHSWWSDGVLMRPLPATVELPEGARGFRRSFGGCCGPYWQRALWREILVPC